jgi:hypothetical protein
MQGQDQKRMFVQIPWDMKKISGFGGDGNGFQMPPS